MLNFNQLQIAIDAAKQHFERLRQKYTDLKAYLVLSLPGEQVEIDGSLKDILTEFPLMVIDDEAKAEALDLLSRIEKSESRSETRQETDQLIKQLNQLASRLKYVEQTQVEIRFKNLNYDLAWKLQTDDLVDRSLTPQTKASIRIILGTLAKFIRDPPLLDCGACNL